MNWGEGDVLGPLCSPLSARSRIIDLPSPCLQSRPPCQSSLPRSRRERKAGVWSVSKRHAEVAGISGSGARPTCWPLGWGRTAGEINNKIIKNNDCGLLCHSALFYTRREQATIMKAADAKVNALVGDFPCRKG